MRLIIFITLFFCISCTGSSQPIQQFGTQEFKLAKTIGKLLSISYGLGDDRLGGAKMGFIDTGVLIKVIDSVSSLYKVQLSKLHSAYIEKSSLFFDTSYKIKPYYLTSSFKSNGTDSMYDIVAIGLEEKLPYSSYMEINPSKIQVLIYGVQSNTNWITQLSSCNEVKNLYYKQIEDDVVQVTIELNHQTHWGYSIGYEGKRLTLKIKKQPSNLSLKNLRIAIDAGHGGSNTGARGLKFNIAEKDYTLLIAKQLKKYLEKKGVKDLYMIRDTDTGIEMKDRVLLTKDFNPDILISIHLNSSNKKEVSGTSTYYKHVGFRPLSTFILNQMLDLQLNEFGNIGSFNFTLNAPTDFVNTLVEVAFLSNEEDEKKIMNPKFHTQVATKITAGINIWLKYVKSID
jgi:N-acetylmuramoyl-L-alanine amidase